MDKEMTMMKMEKIAKYVVEGWKLMANGNKEYFANVEAFSNYMNPLITNNVNGVFGMLSEVEKNNVWRIAGNMWSEMTKIVK